VAALPFVAGPDPLPEELLIPALEFLKSSACPATVLCVAIKHLLKKERAGPISACLRLLLGTAAQQCLATDQL